MQAKYGEALDAAPPAAPQRAVYFANRAAAALKLQQVSTESYAQACSAMRLMPERVLRPLQTASMTPTVPQDLSVTCDCGC